jgi:hypothetical protein
MLTDGSMFDYIEMIWEPLTVSELKLNHKKRHELINTYWQIFYSNVCPKIHVLNYNN